MASAEPQKVPDPEACEPAKGLEEPAPEVVPAPLPPRPTDAFLLADVSLRVVLFAACLTAVVVLVTSNQTKIVAVPGLPFPAPIETKFSHSPAFIFFVAALSVAGLYSIITVLASTSVILKPDFALDFVLFFLLWDVVILGIVASATGAAGAVAYIGLKGNSHAGWNKVCNVYNKYCQHLGAAIPIALFAAVILVLLITLSVLSLHRKVPK